MRILIADDHALMREGLSSALRDFATDVTIVEAEDACQVLRILDDQPDFNLILLDLLMPGANGFELVGTVCNRCTDTPVVVLSASANPADMRRSIDYGAAGFIEKTSGKEVMLSALRLVLAGGVYIPPAMLGVGMSLLEGAASTAHDSPPPVAGDMFPELPLTGRQVEVMRLLAQGEPNKVIARRLGLSENTVKIHVTAILKALNVDNRTQAVVIAQRLATSMSQQR